MRSAPAAVSRPVRAGTVGFEAERCGSLPRVDHKARVWGGLEIPVSERHGVAAGQHEPVPEKRIACRDELHRFHGIAGSK